MQFAGFDSLAFASQERWPASNQSHICCAWAGSPVEALGALPAIFLVELLFDLEQLRSRQLFENRGPGEIRDAAALSSFLLIHGIAPFITKCKHHCALGLPLNVQVV
jgi:hypothetical protein